MRTLLLAVIFAIIVTVSFEALSRASERHHPDSNVSKCSAPETTSSSYLQATPSPEVETTAESCEESGNALGLESGWYKKQEVRYYDFGKNTQLTASDEVEVAPIYAFITGFDGAGKPQLVDGQYNVVDVRPGDTGYSDLWQVIFVTVPDDYEPNSIRSAEGVTSLGFELTDTDLLVNCPIVTRDTELEGGEPLIQAWHKGEQVFYFDFGPTAATTIPIFEFTTGPDYYGHRSEVEGQLPVFSSAPTEDGYSDFARVYLVTVPSDFLPNSIRSAEDVWSSDFEVTQTDVVINAPVLDQ